MAVVYAIKNGNWSDGSTWSSGVVPTVEDDVYLNGYTIELDVVCNITANSISNLPNAEMGISIGGFMHSNSNNGVYDTINADIEYQSFIFVTRTRSGNSYGNFIINGNIKGVGGGIFEFTNTPSSKFIVNGNVDIYSGTGFTGMESGYGIQIEINGNVHTIAGNLADYSVNAVINGNVIMDYRLLSRGADNLTITGSITSYNVTQTAWQRGNGVNISIYGDVYVNGGWVFPFFTGNETIIGNIICSNGGRFEYYSYPTSTMTINGKIRYSGKSIGVNTVNLTILNPDTFDIICNDGIPQLPFDFINTNSSIEWFPKESDVKNNVEYGMRNEYKGRYTPTVLTDEQLQRIANCATMQEVAQLSITIANKDNEE